MLKKIGLLIFCLLSLQSESWADSPLTSCDFAAAYKEVAMVKYATSHPVLDKKLAAFLLDDKNPVDVKAAVINAMGWDINGKNNAGLFAKYLGKKYKQKGDLDFSMMKAADLMCMGYLRALDDYFDVANAEVFLNLAAEKAKGDFTIQLITALVKAQAAMDTNWCEVYKLVDAVVSDTKLQRNMRNEAVDIIMEYIVLYKDDCK